VFAEHTGAKAAITEMLSTACSKEEIRDIQLFWSADTYSPYRAPSEGIYDDSSNDRASSGVEAGPLVFLQRGFRELFKCRQVGMVFLFRV
jgi:hypothetical protein